MTARVDPGALEPVLEALHADWRDAWLPSVQGPALRARLAADPRLDGRLTRSLAERLGASEPDPDDISHADREAYAVALSQPVRFQRLLGLAWHGAALAEAIDGEMLRRYGAVAPPEDFAFALELDALPMGARDLPPPEGFAAAVEVQGARLLRQWAESLSSAYAVRLRLLTPKSEKTIIDKLQSEKDCLSFLVHHVAEVIRPRR